MKSYKITFKNEEVRTMTVADVSVDPVAEVAKWGDEDLSPANIVEVVDL